MTVNSRGTDHRLRSGTQAVVDVTTTYALSAITVPSDELADADFYVVAGDGSECPLPARISQTADGGLSSDGFMTFSWRIPYMTFGMVTNFLAAAGLTSARSAPVTVMTYDEVNQPVFLQAIIVRPQFGRSQDASYAPDGYRNVVWRFVNGIVIT